MYLINGETTHSDRRRHPVRTSLPVTFSTRTRGAASSPSAHTFNVAALNGLASCVRPYGFPNGTNVGSPTNPNVIPSARSRYIV